MGWRVKGSRLNIRHNFQIRHYYSLGERFFRARYCEIQHGGILRGERGPGRAVPELRAFPAGPMYPEHTRISGVQYGK
jgi:hypothetical protein